MTLACERRIQLAERDGYSCFYCDCDVDPKASDSAMEHVIPARWGGANSLDNLVLACRACNAMKGSRVPGWFMVILRALDLPLPPPREYRARVFDWQQKLPRGAHHERIQHAMAGDDLRLVA